MSNSEQEQQPPKASGWYWVKLILFVWATIVIIRTLDQLGIV